MFFLGAGFTGTFLSIIFTSKIKAKYEYKLILALNWPHTGRFLDRSLGAAIGGGGAANGDEADGDGTAADAGAAHQGGGGSENDGDE